MFFNWIEIFDFLNLWNCICKYKINTLTKDFWLWMGNTGGIFTTKEMYEILYVEMIAVDGTHFAWKKLWWRVP